MLFITLFVSDTTEYEYFSYQNGVGFMIACTLLGLFFILQSADMRTIYATIPSIGLLLLFTSGMLVKPDTLPRWAAPWMPSSSAIRWYVETLLLLLYLFSF